MTTEEALGFLENNQPLPADEEMDVAMISYFDEVRKYFIENPDPRCVPLFLNAFGDGDGFGVYQLVEDTMLRQCRDVVITSLRSALQSERRSVRYWSTQIAACYSDVRLVEPLIALLCEDDFDIKYAALTALEHNISDDSLKEIENFSQTERNGELRELSREIISILGGESGHAS